MGYPRLGTFHTLVFDFDGVFTNNKVYTMQDGQEMVRCDRRDGFGFSLLRTFKAKGLFSAELFVLSKEPNPVVAARMKKLNLTHYQGVDNKLDFLTTYFATHRPHDPTPFEGLVYVGNDLNDFRVMRRAKWSYAPADAHPRIQACATAVLAEEGGNSFVRAVIEGLLGIDRLSVDELDALL